MEPQNQDPMMNTTPPTQGEKSVGPAIGIIIIIAVIVIGGLYFWGQRATTKSNETNTTETGATVQDDQNIIDLKNQSSSDEIDSIQADLEATDLDQLGSGVDSIEASASGVSPE